MTRNPPVFILLVGLLVPVLVAIPRAASNSAFQPLVDENEPIFLETRNLTPSLTGVIDDGVRNVMWFVHVTDTQSCWFRENRIGWFHRFFNESVATIQPPFVVNTGDLVNTVYDNLLGPLEGQNHIEWSRYRQVLDEEMMNASYYIDIMGNHDGYGDYGYSFYRNYSMIGSSFAQDDDVLQLSWNVTTSKGQVAFIGLHTPDNFGTEFPFEVFGSMSHRELNWFENELGRYGDADYTVVFGHHPLQDLVSGISATGQTLDMLVGTRGVDGYFYGHNHMNLNEYIPELGGLRAIQTDKFTDNGGSYRIVAIDGFRLSSQPALVGTWPQGIITNPAPADHLSGGLPGLAIADADVVRVLAWDPLGVTAVQVKIGDETTWNNASHVAGPVYELARDVSGLRGVPVYARIIGASGMHEMSIIVDDVPAFCNNFRFTILFIIWGLIGTAAALAATGATLRLKPGSRYKKRPDRNVEPGMRRLLLFKCLILAIVPLTIAPVINNAPVFVFSMFVLSTSPASISFHLVFVLYSVILALGGMVPHAFLLNPRKNHRGIMVAGPVSIALAGIGLVFLLPRYALAWISPGIYLLVACDILMMRRAVSIANQGRPA